MTSPGSSSATATGTSRTFAIFQPMKPIMGSLVQIKSDTFVAWMGGIPKSDWTALKISTAEPQQSSQICPMLDDSSFHEPSKGLDVKFSKEKGDLFSFQCKLLHHFQDTGMDTITYSRIIPSSLRPMSRLPSKRSISFTTPVILPNNHSACYTLLDSLDISFKPGTESTKLVNGCTFHWCSKCMTPLWSTTHLMVIHTDYSSSSTTNTNAQLLDFNATTWVIKIPVHDMKLAFLNALPQAKAPTPQPAFQTKCNAH